MEKRFAARIALLIVAVWAAVALIISAAVGGIRENFLVCAGYVFFLFIAGFVVNIITGFIFKNNLSKGFGVVFYYVSLFVWYVVDKTIRPVENSVQIALCFVVGFFICYCVNRIYILSKQVEDLKSKEKSAKPYLDFFEEKSRDFGMTMYNYLQAIKKYEAEAKGIRNEKDQ